MATMRYKRLWLALGLLLLLTPLGLILPRHFKAGAAWGEWSSNELKSMLGYVPAQLAKLENFWKALLPDYEIRGMAKPWQTKLAYLLSGVIGAGVILLVAWGVGKWLTASSKHEGGHVR